MIREELDELAKGGKFKVFHTITRNKDEKWTGMTGRVTYEMFKQCNFPPPADDVFIFVCGTPPFNETCKGFLKENGYVQGEHYN